MQCSCLIKNPRLKHVSERFGGYLALTVATVGNLDINIKCNISLHVKYIGIYAEFIPMKQVDGFVSLHLKFYGVSTYIVKC
jgi:hypothetical protein